MQNMYNIVDTQQDLSLSVPLMHVAEQVSVQTTVNPSEAPTEYINSIQIWLGLVRLHIDTYKPENQ